MKKAFESIAVSAILFIILWALMWVGIFIKNNLYMYELSAFGKGLYNVFQWLVPSLVAIIGGFYTYNR